jgi:hypothetical protein
MIGPCETRSCAPSRQAAYDVDNVPGAFRLRVISPGDMSIGSNQDVVRAVEFVDPGFVAEINDQQRKTAYSCRRSEALAHGTSR